MPPPKPGDDLDWVVSTGSNVHVAQDRGWFTSYTPFTTTLDGGISVAGVGDVTLPTKTHPSRTGAASQGTMIIRDVLHAPSVFCNIVGTPVMPDCNCVIQFEAGSNKFIDQKSGACIGLIDNIGLYKLRLRGQSAKQTSLDPDKAYMIRATWPSTERARWQAFARREHERQLSRDQDREFTANGDDKKLPNGTAMVSPGPNTNPPLTEVEKEWLKENFSNEFTFLRAYGLSIYKEEDREEGRRILRAFMADESE